MRSHDVLPVERVSRVRSYNVLVPGETIELEPFARFASPGQLCNSSKSAVRALEVMELFCSTRRKLKACEIARAVNIGPSSADLLLKTLVDGGYLVFDQQTKYYWPSPRSAKLANVMNLLLPSDGLLDQIVKAARDDLQKTVNISASQGTFMQVMICRNRRAEGAAVTSGPDGYQRLEVGRRVPLFGSTSGAAWLSSQSHSVIMSCLGKCRRELGALARDPSQILASLERVREQGYAYGGISQRNNLWGVSMALPPSEQGLIHVISVSVPPAELERSRVEIVDYLQSAIAGLATRQEASDPRLLTRTE